MKRLVWLMALIWVPFVSIFGFASPAIAHRIGDSYPHMAFHVFAPMLLITAFVLARRSLHEARTRSQRTLLWLLVLTLPVVVVGNLLELAAAVTRFIDDDWESRRTPDIFGPDAGLHTLGANLTVPALMLSMVVVLALVVTAGVQGSRRLEPVG